MPPVDANQPAPQRYGELFLYAVIFFVLVASVFVLNILLATESRQDSLRVYAATRQTRAWQRVLTNSQPALIALGELQATAEQRQRDSLQKTAGKYFSEIGASVKTFDATLDILSDGGTLTLDNTAQTSEGASMKIQPLQEPRAKLIIDTLRSIWSGGKKDLLLVASSFTASSVDTTAEGQALAGRALDYAVSQADVILDASQRFITTLGTLSEERTSRLQNLQILSLVLGIIVFIAMAVRVSISLRRQDKVIAERTGEVIRQRDTIAQEKELVEQLLLDLRSTQSQLIQSEKMASLGQMVAGVAHEVNTPLGFVKNNIEVIQRNQAIVKRAMTEYKALQTLLESGEPDALDTLEAQVLKVRDATEMLEQYNLLDKTVQILDETMMGIGRIQELIMNLKNFSRLDEAAMKNANLNEGIDSALTIAQNVTKHKLEIVCNYAKTVVAECYPAQLNQVFLNLITNAAQAVEPKGTLTITTAIENGEAILKFADTGKGIKPENLKKIFEPFFTTKPVGQGTGLGLSIAYKIVEKHRGTINVRSEVGKGTEFDIRIPVKQPKTKYEPVSSLILQA